MDFDDIIECFCKILGVTILASITVACILGIAWLYQLVF